MDIDNHVESIVLLSKLHTKQNVEVEMSELDLTAAKSKATYEEISSKYVADIVRGTIKIRKYIARNKDVISIKKNITGTIDKLEWYLYYIK